jgi:maleate isomerase
MEVLGGLDIDLVFASCTNFGAMEAIPELADRLGRPVVTSNQAVLAAAVDQARTVPEPR